jgi:hypothetical protein
MTSGTFQSIISDTIAESSRFEMKTTVDQTAALRDDVLLQRALGAIAHQQHPVLTPGELVLQRVDSAGYDGFRRQPLTIAMLHDFLVIRFRAVMCGM